MNNIINKKFIYFFLIYLSILYLISVFQLHFKHTGGNDSTISEWLINFQGGFTKRGIIGEICFFIAKLFKTELRFIIYIFQISILGIYYFLVFNFFKKFKINFLILLSIFSPIFLLYQVAELEVLGRKEIFIFIGYILFLNLASENFKNKEDLLFIIFVLPILSLIWEPVIFFTPFFICALIFKYKILNAKELIINTSAVMVIIRRAQFLSNFPEGIALFLVLIFFASILRSRNLFIPIAYVLAVVMHSISKNICTKLILRLLCKSREDTTKGSAKIVCDSLMSVRKKFNCCKAIFLLILNPFMFYNLVSSDILVIN